MLPSSRHAQDRWEISLGGQVVGWVQARRYRSIVFYEAVGIHHTTGESVSLELSTDRGERIHTVVRFWVDPLSARQHLPRRLRKLHGLEH